MSAWLETILVMLIAVWGVVFGRKLSKLDKPYWVIAYHLSLAVITILAASRYFTALNFTVPLCWLTTGRTRFIVLALAVTIGLSVCITRLQRKWETIVTSGIMATIILWFSIMPFLAPALIKDSLSNLETSIDPEGVCLQATDYTCGPAAAVTALSKLGLEAQEGQIAVLSHSSPVTGTLPRCLSSALEDLYGQKGLKCRFRSFDSIDQLKEPPITLAIIKDTFFSDHCVAVLDVSDKFVTVADPSFGRMVIPAERFKKIWRYSGIVLERT